jgi:hypothetical protein
MKVYVCTEKPAVKKYFAALKRARSVECTFLKPGELSGFLSDSPPPCILYIDISTAEEGGWRQQLKSLQRSHPNIRLGILDPDGNIADVAELFHQGIADYLNKQALRSGIGTKRIKNIFAFKPNLEDGKSGTGSDKYRGGEAPAVPPGWKTVDCGWKGIQSGVEYTFSIIYVRLDMMEDWRKKAGEGHINAVQKIFHDHVENVFAHAGGRIWMWMNDAGLVLVPFDGKSCPSLLPAVRLILNRDLTSIELYKYNSPITYTIALHIGNTFYKARGKTGDIISDTVNFIFHLAKHYTKPGNLYLTDTVYPFIPGGIEDLFVQGEPFEGTGLYRMYPPKR